MAAEQSVDTPRKTEVTIILAIVIALVVWGGAIAAFGLAALILPAVIATFAIILLLVLISAGG